MRIVQAHGCFDLLHIGHIRHLEAAKKAGDYLVVTVTPDRFVNKGPSRPVFSEQLRLEALRALSCVGKAFLTESPTAADAIRQIKPSVFAKGPDYCAASLDAGEAQALADVGGSLLITSTEKWSSTALLQHAGLSPEVESYLATIRAKYTVADVLGWLEQARSLKALVIGDAIIDVYRYCNSLGKSGKEPILAVQFVREERFIGGADVVGRHVEACADVVDVVSGPATIKRRFLESYPLQKLSIEEYEMDEAAAATAYDHLAAEIADKIRAADLVIMGDYGHGFITADLVDVVSRHAKFLAVNVQANAGNHGFNTISKYPRANFISLSERELRLDARDQATEVGTLMCHQSAKREAVVLITRGAHGCRAVSGEGWAEAPAFASHTVDRMGAGDAVFGVTACLAAVGMPLDLIAFMASAVGSMAVGIVGNARAIEREALVAQITGLLS